MSKSLSAIFFLTHYLYGIWWCVLVHERKHVEGLSDIVTMMFMLQYFVMVLLIFTMEVTAGCLGFLKKDEVGVVDSIAF